VVQRRAAADLEQVRDRADRRGGLREERERHLLVVLDLGVVLAQVRVGRPVVVEGGQAP
jgi:hypothetical protein